MLHQKEFRGAWSPIDGRGRMFSYTECLTDATDPRIRLYVEGQPVGVLYPGETFELGEECSRWDVEALGGADVRGRVLIGNARFHTSRIGSGVQLWRGTSAATMAGDEFIGQLSRTAAAGLFATVGLVAVNETVAVRFYLNNCNASTHVPHCAIAQGSATSPLATRSLINKLAGAADASSELQALDLAAADLSTVPGLSNVKTVEIPLGSASRIIQDRASNAAPIILPPGWGLWSLNSTAAGALSVLCEVSRL